MITFSTKYRFWRHDTLGVQDDRKLSNSGGQEWFFSPGLMWTDRNFAVKAGIRVDGLACPYCAYGIEKKFMQRGIVKTFDMDFKKGLVKVTLKDGEEMTEPQLKQLFDEAGFSYRSVNKKAL